MHQLLGLVVGLCLILVAVVTKDEDAHTPIAITLFICAYLHGIMSLFLEKNIPRRFMMIAATYAVIGILMSIFYNYDGGIWMCDFELLFVCIFSLYLTTFFEEKTKTNDIPGKLKVPLINVETYVKGTRPVSAGSARPTGSPRSARSARSAGSARPAGSAGSERSERSERFGDSGLGRFA